MAAPRFPNPLCGQTAHLNVYQLNLLQRKDLHILSFSRLMEIYPTRFVSTRFVSIRGHQFFLLPFLSKVAIRGHPLQKWIAQKQTVSCFYGSLPAQRFWTVTNWGQASVSLNRRPSQRSQINSCMTSAAGWKTEVLSGSSPPIKKKRQKIHDTKTRIKKALLIWIFKFHVWLLNLHEHLGGGKSCAWKLR